MTTITVAYSAEAHHALGSRTRGLCPGAGVLRDPYPKAKRDGGSTVRMRRRPVLAARFLAHPRRARKLPVGNFAQRQLVGALASGGAGCDSGESRRRGSVLKVGSSAAFPAAGPGAAAGAQCAAREFRPGLNVGARRENRWPGGD